MRACARLLAATLVRSRRDFLGSSGLVARCRTQARGGIEASRHWRSWTSALAAHPLESSREFVQAAERLAVPTTPAAGEPKHAGHAGHAGHAVGDSVSPPTEAKGLARFCLQAHVVALWVMWTAHPPTLRRWTTSARGSSLFLSPVARGWYASRLVLRPGGGI